MPLYTVRTALLLLFNAAIKHYMQIFNAVAKPKPEPGGAALQQHQTSPPSAKRHAATANSLHKTAPAAKRAKVGKPEKGTIESFFGRKK